MATRSNTTFQKRQKEQARMEKARDKLAKRAHRKTHKGETPAEEEVATVLEPMPDMPLPPPTPPAGNAG